MSQNAPGTGNTPGTPSPAPAAAPNVPTQPSTPTPPNASSQQTVNAIQKGTHSRVDRFNKWLETSNLGEEYEIPDMLRWSPLSKIETEQTSTSKHLRNALLTTAFVANPVATGVVGGGAYVGSKLWGKVNKYPPFSWADKAARGTYNVAKEGIGSTLRVASYPFRLAGKLSLNTMKTVAIPIHYLVNRLFIDLPQDLLAITVDKFKLPKRTSILSAVSYLVVKPVGLVYQHFRNLLGARGLGIAIASWAGTVGLGSFAAYAMSNGVASTFISIGDRLASFLGWLLGRIFS